MAERWEPKPGDIVYSTCYDIYDDDDELTNPEACRRALANVVIVANGKLACVSLYTKSPAGVHYTNAEGECGDEAVNLVYAIPFEPQDYAPTLAEALRRAAESDIEYHGRQAAAGRAVLALAEELAATPAKAQ